MISLLTLLLLSTFSLATNDNWTLTLDASRNGSITEISTIINGSIDDSSILIPLIVNGKSAGVNSNQLKNGSYHLNLVGASLDGQEIYSKCAQIKDERGKIHSVCASDDTGMCSRTANLADLRVNSISIIDSNHSFDLTWNCQLEEKCCDYGCCKSEGYVWQLSLITLAIFLILLILLLSIYCCCCRKKREEETHRHPAPTVSTRPNGRESSMRIRVITDPSHSLSSNSSRIPPSRPLLSNQSIRVPSAPPVSNPSPSSNLPPYPLSINPSAPPMTSSERSLSGWKNTDKST